VDGIDDGVYVVVGFIVGIEVLGLWLGMTDGAVLGSRWKIGKKGAGDMVSQKSLVVPGDDPSLLLSFDFLIKIPRVMTATEKESIKTAKIIRYLLL